MAFAEINDKIKNTELTVDVDDCGFIQILLAHSGEYIYLSTKEAQLLKEDLMRVLD